LPEIGASQNRCHNGKLTNDLGRFYKIVGRNHPPSIFGGDPSDQEVGKQAWKRLVRLAKAKLQ
jgi:hypothetical protein